MVLCPARAARRLAFDARRLHYLECLAKRATLKSEGFTRWNEAERRRAPEPDPDEPGKFLSPKEAGHATLCDAVRDVGLAALDPGLDRVNDRLDRLRDFERDAIQRDWLLSDDRTTALGRALLVRAQPERQDELFGWERTGLNPDEYWMRSDVSPDIRWSPHVPTTHMEYLLETADFGANEVLRILYLLDETPEHLLDKALLWRDADKLGRDANYPARATEALHTSFTNFKYWFDDPFRCEEFGGQSKRIREQATDVEKHINPHEKMESGQDMTYWSENHRLLFAAAEYLAGQYWPDELFISMRNHRKEGPGGAARPGDMTGKQHMSHARVRVLRWLNERLRMGFAEWNAPGYYVEDVLPLLNLVDFAADPEIRTRAAMVMDLLVFDLAVHSQSGAFAGSAGRAYFENKNCVWEQSIRDTAELLFGQLGHFTEASNAAIFLATSPAYRPPDALIALATSAPPRFTSRSRVSINFDEAADYGVGFSTADDMEFWWSRAAYFTKHTIIDSRRVATESGLLSTPPFSAILPQFEKIAKALDTADDIGHAFAGFLMSGPVGAIAGGIGGAPERGQQRRGCRRNVLSTHGGIGAQPRQHLLPSHRRRHAGQRAELPAWAAQLPELPCVAALANGAMVWTSYPSAGSRLEFRLSTASQSPMMRYVLSLFFGIFAYVNINVDEDIFPANHDGPNWWTGNVVQPRVVQQGGAAITAYKAEGIQELLFGERTHAWFPKSQFDETRGPDSARCNHDSARWFFGRSGDSYVALFCALETTWTDNGPWKDKEIRVEGDTNVFITQIGSAAEFGSFEGFMAKVSRARVHISGLHSSGAIAMQL